MLMTTSAGPSKTDLSHGYLQGVSESKRRVLEERKLSQVQIMSDTLEAYLYLQRSYRYCEIKFKDFQRPFKHCFFDCQGFNQRSHLSEKKICENIISDQDSEH